MTATEKAALERRIDELCAEVERLREQGARLFDKTLELGTENAKLRQENQSIGMAAYEVGYKDASAHYELEHCPACKNIADLQEALEENAKLQELFNETLIRLAAASEATGGRFVDARYCELLESNGIEVDE